MSTASPAPVAPTPASPDRPVPPAAPTAAPAVSAPVASAPVASAPAPSEPAPRPRRDPLRTAARFSPLLGLGVSVGLVAWGWESGVLRSLENLQAYIDGLGAWGPLAFLVASIASVMFPVIPGGLLVIAGPVLFGPVEGTVLNYVAVCAGSMLNFAVGRRVGVEIVDRLFPERTVRKVRGWTSHPHATRAFAVAIALPVAPDDLLCYLAGTTRMRWRTFALIILLCKPWALLAYGLGVSALLLHLLPW